MMKTNRRKFISTAVAGGMAATAMPLTSCASGTGNPATSTDLAERYARLDEILKEPLLKRELFPDPVVIESIELLRDRNNFLCRVRSKDGAEGMSVGHPNISRISWPVMNNLINSFKGKDARDLDELIYRVSQPGSKRAGVPERVQIATLEFAVLDMLGNIAGVPAGKLIGEIHNPKIAVYQGFPLRGTATPSGGGST